MSEARRRFGRALRIAGVVLGSLAVAVAGVEVGTRWLDPFGVSYYRDVTRYFNEGIDLVADGAHPEGRIFQNKPSLALDLTTFGVSTDEYGFRSGRGAKTGDLAKASDELRILFLGDSVTFSWGVDDEDTWVRRLESVGKVPGGARLRCFNAGHPHYNTTQEADLFALVAPLLQPDLVVLTYVVNDIEDVWAMYEGMLEAAAGAEQAPAGAFTSLKRRLPVWFVGIHGLIHFWDVRREAKSIAELGAQPIAEMEGYAEGWLRSETALAKILEQCRQLDVPLVVFDHSVPRIREVRPWCEDNEVLWIDLTFTESEWARGVTNSVADAHANELGNEILAEKALAALAEAGFLEPGTGD